MRRSPTPEQLASAAAALEAWPVDQVFSLADFSAVDRWALRAVVRQRAQEGRLWMPARGLWLTTRWSRFRPDRPMSPTLRALLLALHRRTGDRFGRVPMDALNAVGLSTQVVVREVASTTSFRRQLHRCPASPEGQRRTITLVPAPAWHFLHPELNPVLAALDALDREHRLSPWDWQHFAQLLPAPLWADLVTLDGLPPSITASRSAYLKAPPRGTRPRDPHFN